MHNISHYLSNLTIYPVIYLSAYVDNYFLIEKHFKYQQFTLTLQNYFLFQSIIVYIMIRLIIFKRI